MTAGAGAGGPVAFIDDDADLRRATAQMLTLAGYEVQAFDGAEAALAPADTPPELALARQGRAGAVHYHLLRRNT